MSIKLYVGSTQMLLRTFSDPSKVGGNGTRKKVSLELLLF